MDEVKVKSLVKAMRVLECFSSETPELGVTQISEQLDLNKSNVYNILSTFERMGYAEQDQATGKYRLGLNLLRFSYVINENLGYQRIVSDILQEAARKLGTVTYFAIPRSEVFYLYSAYPATANYDFPFRSIAGATAPYHCTSLGKAMLAFMTQEEAGPIVAGPKARFTDTTITDEAALWEDIARIRAKGYSMDECEHEYGVRCVGVPVLTPHAQLFGAVSASGSLSNMRDDRLEEIVHTMKEAAFCIKERL